LTDAYPDVPIHLAAVGDHLTSEPQNSGHPLAGYVVAGLANTEDRQFMTGGEDRRGGPFVSRPSWDEYFMSIAFQVAKRSTCDRAQVGAIIVKDRRILTTGYNGAPSGLPHCDDVGHLLIGGHCVRAVHAEQNAIVQAALHGVSVKGGTIYVTHQPCLTCAKLIINAGVVRVVYAGEYPDELARSFLTQAGVSLERFPLTQPDTSRDEVSLRSR